MRKSNQSLTQPSDNMDYSSSGEIPSDHDVYDAFTVSESDSYDIHQLDRALPSRVVKIPYRLPIGQIWATLDSFYNPSQDLIDSYLSSICPLEIDRIALLLNVLEYTKSRKVIDLMALYGQQTVGKFTAIWGFFAERVSKDAQWAPLIDRFSELIHK